jgi:hypothetical protein
MINNIISEQNDFIDKVLEEYNLTIDDFTKEEPKEKKLGLINKKIWEFRNWTKSQTIKEIIDSYLVGGMTQEEQEHYLPFVRKDPIKLSRSNAYIDLGLTVFLSLFPLLMEYILHKNTKYKGNAGLITSISAISQSFAIAAYRIGYTFVKKKPIESFSILSLVANSTTYIKRTDGLRELLNVCYPGNFDFEKITNNEYLKDNAKNYLSK